MFSCLGWAAAINFKFQISPSVHLFRAPVRQRSHMCQNTQVGETGVTEFSVSHLGHHWAQSEHLMGSHLTHWSEGLDWMKNQIMLQLQIMLILECYSSLSHI